MHENIENWNTFVKQLQCVTNTAANITTSKMKCTSSAHNFFCLLPEFSPHSNKGCLCHHFKNIILKVKINVHHFIQHSINTINLCQRICWRIQDTTYFPPKKNSAHHTKVCFFWPFQHHTHLYFDVCKKFEMKA